MQFLKELRDNAFSGSDHEDANKHIEKVLEIVDLFHVPNITQDQIMLQIFPMSLIGATSRWLRNKPSGSIKTWEDLKIKFLIKYCPPTQTAKKMEEINNFQQEPDETLYQTAVDAKVAIQEMDEYSHKWHNRTSRTRSTKTSDGLAAIQAQLNNLGREIKKVNKKVYAAQVGCGQCKGPHYTKDFPLKEEVKRHEENSNLIKEIRASTAAAIRNQGASIKTLEIQIGQMSKSILTTVEADMTPICRTGSSQYAVSAQQNNNLMFESRQTTIRFPICLNDYYYDEKKGSYGLQCSDAYSYGAIRVDDSLP
nr:hypothetical protein [Tanacetum cinerariifolium]